MEVLVTGLLAMLVGALLATLAINGSAGARTRRAEQRCREEVEEMRARVDRLLARMEIREDWFSAGVQIGLDVGYAKGRRAQLRPAGGKVKASR